MCWNKALTFSVGSIKLFSYHCVHPIHAKMFSIQMLLHFSQISRRVCTLSAFHYNYKYSACVMTFGEFFPLLAMLLSHVVVDIPILSPFLFAIPIFLIFKSKDFYLLVSFRFYCLRLFVVFLIYRHVLSWYKLVTYTLCMVDT